MSLDSLKSSRSATKGCITRIRNLIEQKKESITVPEAQCRLGILESYFKQILTYQEGIESLVPEDTTQERQRAEIEDLYVNTKTKILAVLTDRRASFGEASQAQSSFAFPATLPSSLPKVKLPMFSGEYTDYTSFMSTFKVLVDDDARLTDVEKFRHLQQCLTGKAKGAIDNLEITSGNYKKALASLKARFDVKTLIFEAHITKMFNLLPVSKNSANELRCLMDEIASNVEALKTIGTTAEILDAILIHLACERLDSETIVKWEENRDLEMLPTWTEFTKVLTRRCQFLEVRSQNIAEELLNRRDRKHALNPQHNKKSFGGNRSTSLVTSTKSSEEKCASCDSPGHTIHKCPQFLSLSVNDRFARAKARSLCINCLAKGHTVKNCKSSHCRVCGGPHHSKLHRFASNEQSSPVVVLKNQLSPTKPSDVHQCDASTLISSSKSPGNSRNSAKVILATAIVQVKDQSGCYHNARVLLDSASQVNLMTEGMANKLRLRKGRFEGKVDGIGESQTKIRFTTNTTIKSRINEFQRDLHFWLIPSITDCQPEQRININEWNIPSNIKLADPSFNQPQGVEILLGTEIFFELLSVGQIALGQDLPVLQKSQLGWIVAGRYKSTDRCTTLCSTTNENSDPQTSLEKLVERFWSLEEVSALSSTWTAEQLRCEQLFLETVTRDEDGRFVVRLPFRDNHAKLGNSFDIALQRFLSLERRLNRNADVKQQYINFLRDYENLGHMEIVDDSDIASIKYFLPHQFVMRPESTSTKLRVVFDGGCRTSSNTSLNDILMVGPTIQNDVFTILFKFRFHKYALMADIVKMYRQIKVAQEDTTFQGILWRENNNERLRAFRLTTVTYGTSPAPFLATRCLNYLADEFAETFPHSSHAIRNDFYVDNLISGADSLEGITQLRSEINYILSTAQLPLKKWCSNHQTFLEGLTADERETPLRIGDSDIVKTLGLNWEPGTDKFRYVTPPDFCSHRVTKRTILADISKLFDPLGLINPVIVKGKILLQELWKLKADWDESLPMSLHSEWKYFCQQLTDIHKIHIPRFVLSLHAHRRVELHGFGDASMKCYGCCIYLRSLDTEDNIKASLLCAKSKLAPVKIRTLPELELSASYLLATLLHRILGILPIKPEKIYLWTDSSIVLDWLALPPSTWTVFVSNRVARIQDLTSGCEWRHVPSKLNPADTISRGATPSELLNSLWFTGPSYLQSSKEFWPEVKVVNPERCLLGRRKTKLTLVSTTRQSDCVATCKFINDYSKLRHVFAYVQRFINNIKLRLQGLPTQLGSLTSQELSTSETLMVFVVQQRGFSEEITQLSNNKPSKITSSIKNLNPFLDGASPYSLLRVGGRLKNANLPYSTRCPILVPKDHPLLTSYVSHLHWKYLHAGSQTLINMVRQKYWATNLRRVTTKVVRSCIHCFRYKPVLAQQIMGDLPASRVLPDRPFRKSGVDFCGPFWTRSLLRGGRKFKSYAAVFVCFCTKAVHLEVVSELSSKAFIAALHRFISRRGMPTHIFCDNATNFVGARNELAEFRKRFFEQDIQDSIRHMCTEDNTEFKHIPPRAPHFGGLWEAAVRAAKTLLFKTCKDFCFTFEEFSTLLARIEAVLNSRPLTPLSSEPSDEEALTPAHFLVGGSLLTPLQPEVHTQNISLLNRWNRIQALVQHLWRRWSHEYLLELQRRHKWQHAVPNLSKDTLVLIAEDHLPPQKWLLGRLIDTISGNDRKTRVVDIKTKNGIIRRPIHKIAPLPMNFE